MEYTDFHSFRAVFLLAHLDPGECFWICCFDSFCEHGLGAKPGRTSARTSVRVGPRSARFFSHGHCSPQDPLLSLEVNSPSCPRWCQASVPPTCQIARLSCVLFFCTWRVTNPHSLRLPGRVVWIVWVKTVIWTCVCSQTRRLSETLTAGDSGYP